MSDDFLPDSDSAFGGLVRRRLRDDRVAWLTTIGRDETPQPNPIWFVWLDPDRLLIYNRADAYRLAHIANRPRVAVHFNGTGDGGSDIVVLIGTAEVSDGWPPPHERVDYMSKYDKAMVEVSGSPEAFSAEYPVPVVVHLERVRGF